MLICACKLFVKRNRIISCWNINYSFLFIPSVIVSRMMLMLSIEFSKILVPLIICSVWVFYIFYLFPEMLISYVATQPERATWWSSKSESPSSSLSSVWGCPAGCELDCPNWIIHHVIALLDFIGGSQQIWVFMQLSILLSGHYNLVFKVILVCLLLDIP